METPSTAPPVDCVEEIFRELTQTRFWGTLEIKFEAGVAVILRKSETIKPAGLNYPATGGSKNARRSIASL